MAYITGKKVILSFYKDGDYVPYLCATSCSLTITTETKQVRTIGDGVWKKPRGQSLSYTAQLAGLIELQEVSPVTFWLIQNYQLQMLSVPFRMLFIDDTTNLEKICSGNMLIVTTLLQGVPVGHATGTFDFEGDGELVIADAVEGCYAVLGTLEVGAGDPDAGVQATIAWEGVAGAARLEYSIDGGDRLVIFSPGPSGFINLSGLAEGGHTVQVWVVCENGIDGETNSVTFPIEAGGEPGPTCAAPGIPEITEITSVSARADWTAAAGPPAQGYFWELRFAATDNLSQSGYTSDNFVELIGLFEADFYFQVKSLCEEGVSESSYRRADFTASDAPPPDENTIAWSLTASSIGPLIINMDGVEVVNEFTTISGSFSAPNHALIEVIVSGPAEDVKELNIHDDTASITLTNQSDFPDIDYSFSVTNGHDYTIVANVIDV